MLKLLTQVFFYIFILSSTALSQPAEELLEGHWQNEEESMVIEFYEKNDLWHARIVAIEDSLDRYGDKKRDIYNTDASMRARKIIGIDYLYGLKYKENSKKWTGGTLYNYQNGNTYNAIMNMDEDENLYIKGYWSYFRFLGSATLWQKIKEK
ncbi:MAG: DUF2147 domain-containing protein [Chitinophagales bacterium]